MIIKKYLVKPVLQLKYLSLFVAVIILLGFLCYHAFFNSLISVHGMETLSAETVKNFRSIYTNGFFWIVFVFSVFIVIQSLFLFYKIIGPLSASKKALNKAAKDALKALDKKDGEKAKKLLSEVIK